MNENDIGVVLAVKDVSLKLVAYRDKRGREYAQLAVVGENHVRLLDNKKVGFSPDSTPAGDAAPWLAKGILARTRK